MNNLPTRQIKYLRLQATATTATTYLDNSTGQKFKISSDQLLTAYKVTV